MKPMDEMAYRFGLVGFPLTYSFSPIIHQVFLETCGEQGSYELIPIAVDAHTNERLRAVCARMRRGDYDGINVTIPHKQGVMACIDTLDEKARAVGAVNTLYRSGDVLIGTNTDVEGFLLDVGQKLSLAEAGTALILGAGGAARAVAWGLLKSGWQVWIAARRLEQAREIVCDLSTEESNQSRTPSQIRALSWQDGIELVMNGSSDIRLVINATPLGTKGLEEKSPLPAQFLLPEDTCFYDLVYNPPETAFMRLAREKGYQAWNGFGMLLWQAALAFECWTGYKISITPEIESKITSRIRASDD
ncbi:MAG: Shikimate 5-dehydrogenase I alpha [Anaerolineae bacterium]|nr:MAG: Shikimate 5-dehydrogenase I alpha [Anaerolineae bacterium]